jgi:hypothetical protein
MAKPKKAKPKRDQARFERKVAELGARLADQTSRKMVPARPRKPVL